MVARIVLNPAGEPPYTPNPCALASWRPCVEFLQWRRIAVQHALDLERAQTTFQEFDQELLRDCIQFLGQCTIQGHRLPT
jgi:hypothetical protein